MHCDAIQQLLHHNFLQFRQRIQTGHWYTVAEGVWIKIFFLLEVAYNSFLNNR